VFSIKLADFSSPVVQALVAENLADLSARYGGNGDDTPIGESDFSRRHGADAELKRMFTVPSARGLGVARRMLAAVEESAREAGCRRVILETGDRQPEAVGLYESAGYERIEDFGFYAGDESVLSYAKAL
jgi:GNAT superfamily N-acetyltransferase